MERKILTFLKGWLKNQGACCPKEELDSFLINELHGNERDDAIAFIDQLINKKWIQQVFKDGREFIAVSGYGAEMLKKIT
ncbi:MAG: hypothetical protein IJO75_02335 [Clostridia bacterium]|nr:hypothetical protein [Clostridia bacterium]